jgi:methionyl-tRNA synthetase
LANDLGNLVNRTLNMTGRFHAGTIPAAAAEGDEEKALRALWDQTGPEFVRLAEGFQFHLALDTLFAFVRAINGYIEKRAPWKLGKSADPADRAKLDTALAVMAEALRLAATALEPVMPTATAKIHEVLGRAVPGLWTERLAWGQALAGATVAPALVLFPKPTPAR